VEARVRELVARLERFHDRDAFDDIKRQLQNGEQSHRAHGMKAPVEL
jgi:hypothetical protein